MVVNLCQPHFETTVHCNKLCADGYDVTNLVSPDPALRRRGFKLEYFLRPPLQVTLKFGFQVELCRVDLELWPWGMDLGQACKKLEISTTSERVERTDHKKVQLKDQDDKNQHKHQKGGNKSQQTNGHRWTQLSQQWAEPQQTGRAFNCQSNAESNCEPEFKLVGRCEVREETQVCFTSSHFQPRAPFRSPPPPAPADCRQVELWSRGLPSLGAVTQLRVTVPYGGSASSLGLKALTVWGQPSRFCPTKEVERIRIIHEGSKRQLQRPAFFALSDRQTTRPPESPQTPSVSIPEDFLDPLTQEVMMLPMLLPGGVSVDTTTLDEYQKREASWGRQPNDPFTGVPFTSVSYPLPNPQLKGRIDHFLLQTGITRRDGVVGRQDQGENPQASRLVTSVIHGQSQKCPGLITSSANCYQLSSDGSVQQESSLSNTQNSTSEVQFLSTDKLDRREQSPGDISKESDKLLTTINELEPQTKRLKKDSVSGPSCSSHEQRLSASLDEALLSALRGRPSFTANLTHNKEAASDPDPPKTQQCQSSGLPGTSTGEVCSGCSSSVSVYSTSSSSIYRLICGHLLCRTCLQKRSKLPNSSVASTPGRVFCPTCKSPTTRSDIMRVHH
ncbi:RING finger protein 37 [Cololabis saira]|uniref:RING finger protein 37 n=1 Tax=Cololabis saira TaxID=129043 RepID=UPI002AD4969B|nr:RING finger protein 37 [Cololabis saira]